MKANFTFNGHALSIDFDTGILSGENADAVESVRKRLEEEKKQGEIEYPLHPGVEYAITDPFANPKDFVAAATANSQIILDKDFAQPYHEDIYYELCPEQLRPEEYEKLSAEEKEGYDAFMKNLCY